MGKICALAVTPEEVAEKDLKLERLIARCGYCGLCKDILRDCTGHISRRPKCKAHPGTRNLDKQELADLVAEYVEERLHPDAAKRRRVDKAKAKHVATWDIPTAADVPCLGPYRVEFGKFSKMTVLEVHAKDPLYFAHMMSSTQGTLLRTHPRLEEALRTEGLLDSLVSNLPDKSGRCTRRPWRKHKRLWRDLRPCIQR